MVFITNQQPKTTLLVTLTVAAVMVLLGSSAAWAVPPHTVKFAGTPVTTAVPGKPFTASFEVANTDTDTFSGVEVIFHIPKELTHSKVSPPNANILDDTITWTNVPIAAGGTFSPSLTLTMKEGTPLKTKTSIWVEVTGDGMEANSQNFSITAVATTATKTTTSSSSLITQINAIHRAAFGRNPTSSEHTYWLGRVTKGEKSTYGTLLGAMQYHQLNNIPH